ncbi:MAG: radical SAM protein [Candidatus Woesearchaeota archaeon]
MKILLVRPKVERNTHLLDRYFYNPLIGKSKFIVPPLSLAIIASLTPKENKVYIIDENIEDIDLSLKPDLVGITITSITAVRGFKIADMFRSFGVPVVLGGLHVTLMPNESKKHADSIVIGEAEGVWPRLFQDFCSGKLKKVYRGERIRLENLPMPRWDLLKNDRYMLATVIATRGCPHGCEFCVSSMHFGNKIRKMHVEDFVSQIKYLKKWYNFFWIVDYNLFFDVDYAKKLLAALIPEKINYVCFGNAYIAEDDELLDIMSKSGCQEVSIGFETLNRKNLELIGKHRLNEINKYGKVIVNFHKHGIMAKPLFIMGFDHDYLNAFGRVEEFLTTHSILFTDIFVAAAYYGTPHYKRLKKEGRINTQYYKNSLYAFAQWDSKSLNTLDMILNIMRLYQNLYSYDGFFRRVVKFTKKYGRSRFNPKEQRGFKPFFDKIRLSLYCIYTYKPSKAAFVLKLMWHPHSFYRKRVYLVPSVLSAIEWRQNFCYAFFYDVYMHWKSRKAFLEGGRKWQSFQSRELSDLKGYVDRVYRYYSEISKRKKN